MSAPKFKRDDLTAILELIKKRTGQDIKDGKQIGFMCKIMSNYTVDDITKCCESMTTSIDSPVTFLSYLLRRDCQTKNRVAVDVGQFWKT